MNKRKTLDINKNLMNEINKFLLNSYQNNSLSDLLSDGLEVFYNSDFVISCSLFLRKNNDFEYRLSYPKYKKKDYCDLFGTLDENNILNRLINKGDINYFKKDLSNENEFLIIPLNVSLGNIGFVILEIESNSKDLVNEQLIYFINLAGILGISIERLKFDIFDSNENIKQSVAIKTKDFVEKNEDFENILNILDIGIIILDSDYNIILINSYILKLFGSESIKDDKIKIISELKKIEMLNRKDSNLTTFNNEIVPIIYSISNIMLRNKKVKIFSILNITERKKAFDNLLKLNNELEEVINERTEDLEKSINALEREINNKKLIEKELRILINKEKELNQLKTKFVETVSHELRTPLTVIRSTAQLLELYDEKLKKEDKTNYLNRIINMVDSLTDLIHNVSIIDNKSNYDKIKIQNVNILFIIEKNIEHLQKIQNKKNQFIIVNNLNTKEIEFDNKLFNLLINNIISNAIKFSNTGSKISITLSESDNSISISVEDEGIGISKNDLKNIFSAFYRGENVGATSGTGLGLKVVKDILNKFNGKINIDSKLNNGTKLTIILPKIYEEK